jgi:hypothetical protein
MIPFYIPPFLKGGLGGIFLPFSLKSPNYSPCPHIGGCETCLISCFLWLEVIYSAKALEVILGQVAISRLIEPGEVASRIGELYLNEVLAGDTFFIHGGLRPGSKG